MLVFLGLGNAKVLSFALGDAKVPNANGFVSQWNIGLSVMLSFVHIGIDLGRKAVRSLGYRYGGKHARVHFDDFIQCSVRLIKLIGKLVTFIS